MVNCKCCGSCLVTPLLPRPPAKLAQPHLTHCSRRHIFYLWDDSDDQVIKTQSCILVDQLRKQKWLTFASLSNQRRKVSAQPTQTLQCDVIWRNADITHSYCRLLLPLSSQIYLLCSVTGILVNATPAHIYLSPAQHKIYACCRACGLHTPFTSVCNPK